MGTQYEKKYNDLMECLRQMHTKNVKRTTAALKSLLIVPTVFLVMLFFTNSSKTIFLVLWIASMFIIATILIVIEYQDYTLRQMISRIEDSGDTPPALEESAQSLAGGDPRAQAIRSSIRSRSPENDTGFEYDNYEESPASGKDE